MQIYMGSLQNILKNCIHTCKSDSILCIETTKDLKEEINHDESELNYKD